MEKPDKQPVGEWMEEHHARVREAAMEKALKYGSSDLEIMGKAMQMLIGAPPPPDWDTMSQEEKDRLGQQAAIAFYNLGKLARVISNFSSLGHPVASDSWWDGEVYAMMGFKIGATGTWTTKQDLDEIRSRWNGG